MSSSPDEQGASYVCDLRIEVAQYTSGSIRHTIIVSVLEFPDLFLLHREISPVMDRVVI